MKSRAVVAVTSMALAVLGLATLPQIAQAQEGKTNEATVKSSANAEQSGVDAPRQMQIEAAQPALSRSVEGRWEATAGVSTTGFGLELKRTLGETFAVRALVNGGKAQSNANLGNIDYNGDLKLSSAGAVLDYHPGGQWFRLSAGLFFNGTELNVDGKPSGGTFKFNGTTYTAAQIGSVKGKVQFDHLAPYVGVGVARAPASEAGITLNADLGALLVGAPKSSLSVRCGSVLPSVTCTQLQSDANVERSKFEHDAHRYSVYPVISFGVGYRW